MFLRCKHPAAFLLVKRAETVERKNDDFERVTYHLYCYRCEKKVDIAYSRMIGGVDAFLERGGVK